MSFFQKGPLIVHLVNGAVQVNINEELIIKKKFEREEDETSDILVEKVMDFFETTEFKESVQHKGYKHYYKVFVNGSGSGFIQRENLQGMYKTLEKAKEKLTNYKGKLESYIIYEVYKKGKEKHMGIVQAKTGRNYARIYGLPNDLEKVYGVWKKRQQIIYGLQNGKIPYIDVSIWFSIEQYERMSVHAIQALIEKPSSFEKLPEENQKKQWSSYLSMHPDVQTTYY